jgi:hypothetical protein
LRGGVEQEFIDIARVGPPAHHVQQPEAAALVAAELDADGPIGVVELGLFGGGEIPITDDVEIRRDLINDDTPLPLEIEPGGRPDLPIATQQPLALEQRQRQQLSEIFRVDAQQSGVVEHRNAPAPAVRRGEAALIGRSRRWGLAGRASGWTRTLTLGRLSSRIG